MTHYKVIWGRFGENFLVTNDFEQAEKKAKEKRGKVKKLLLPNFRLIKLKYFKR